MVTCWLGMDLQVTKMETASELTKIMGIMVETRRDLVEAERRTNLAVVGASSHDAAAPTGRSQSSDRVERQERLDNARIVRGPVSMRDGFESRFDDAA